MIDILMATYNGEKYLRQQIDSILNQSFTDWRLIIRDDGSHDNTLSIINEYTENHKDKIILLSDNEKSCGAKYNFFCLIKNSLSEYVMLADQDDVWEKDKVKHAYDNIVKMEGQVPDYTPVLLYGDLKVTDSSLNIVSRSMFQMQKLDGSKNEFRDYLVQNNVTGCTVIFNSHLRKMCSLMPENAIMHDWWLALIAAAFGRTFYMKDNDILYRQHGNNTEGAKNLKSPVYLLKKLFNRSEVKATLINTYNQAEAFKEIFGKNLDEKNKEIIDAYISLKNSGKLKKYRIIKKYGFMKSGLARKLGYILYI